MLFKNEAGYEVHEFRLKHLPQMFGIAKDLEDFWSDGHEWVTESVSNFAKWWYANVNYSTVVLKDGKVAGFFYINGLKPNYLADVHVAFHPDHRDHNNTFEMTQISLYMIFQKFNLHIVRGMVSTLHDKRLSYLTRNGFQIDGIKRAHKFRNEQWEDFYVGTITREEYENLHDGKDRHGERRDS